ncbi:MFS transporter [Nocardia mexicana]|uniref:CP family cyanate transporter-like MFS transporter n=1 Tax=Nocardia mexicana TaxID=279262 RepID=A0A370HET5_9NOCA|nr:MFS transporter [Nocardia mexicana]RDI53403.1 CP family cyanate transporter-like MFS transporter [Nocardia mexicana]
MAAQDGGDAAGTSSVDPRPRTVDASTSSAPPLSAARLAVLVAVIAAVAVNLRPGIATVGPELDEITTALGAGARAAGVITALPVIAFAVVSLVVPLVRGRISVRAGLFGALAVTGVSLAIRPWGGLWLFAVTTFTASLGVGLLAVLLPAVVRASGNTRVLVTTFTTALQAGAALGFATVVPLSDLFGGWQWALAVWAVLAPLGILALWRSPTTGTGSPVSARGEQATRAGEHATSPKTTPHGQSPDGRSAGSVSTKNTDTADTGVNVSNSRAANPITILRDTGTVGLAVFFGLQALVAFVVMGWLPSVLRDAGVGASAAGGYLGLLTFLGVPLSLTVPPLVARSARPERWLAGFSLFTVLGVLAFLVAPSAAPLLWSLILGTGLAVFSLALTVITVRAGAADQAVELSGAVQGVGYVIAAIGPYVIGVFRQLGDGWALPLGVLLATAVAQALVALSLGGNPKPTADKQFSDDNGRRTP